MKIVGGKEIPGTTETGAFVTAIYPGLIADQLNGELEVGKPSRKKGYNANSVLGY